MNLDISEALHQMQRFFVKNNIHSLLKKITLGDIINRKEV